MISLDLKKSSEVRKAGDQSNRPNSPGFTYGSVHAFRMTNL